MFVLVFHGNEENSNLHRGGGGGGHKSQSLTLEIYLVYFLLTALTELEELNVDKTVITDEGCAVLSSKHFLCQFLEIFKKKNK